ncbi:Dehydrodolichyl diphosphate synthase 6 [Linum perenne]
MRSQLFKVLRVGPIPTHFSFIMDGNRRLGVKYISIYAFSIDNFKRRSDEVKIIMDLILEKMEGLLEEGSLANQYGVRVYFVGNLNLLTNPVRVAAQNVMEATSRNTNCVLLICLAYTSRDEITHAIHESCRARRLEDRGGEIELGDIERHMDMSAAPEPDILMRSSGERRLSNYQLWQTGECMLYSPKALWPEIGLWHVVWGVLKYQRGFGYLERKKKKMG